MTLIIAILLSLAAAAMPPSEIAPSAPRLWMPEQASTVADNVDGVFHLITWISIFFFVLITALLVYFVVKYRRVEGRAAEESPTHHTTLELTWTIVPLLLVILIFYMGMQGYIHLYTVPADAYRVNVTAQKWQWNFQHTNGCIEANLLKVPVNRPVQLVMASDDVLHSLFIPAFRVKMDVVPGRYTTLWFEATRTGEFDLYCAEYCGTAHSQMVGRVIVYEEEDFHAALDECAGWVDRVPREALYLAGARLFNQRGCTRCHTVDPEYTVLTGPSLRETHDLLVAGGQRELQPPRPPRVVDEEYIRDSILRPGLDVVAGFQNTMPVFQGLLRETEVFALYEFIRRLDEFEFDDRGQLIVPPLPDPVEDGEAPAPPQENGEH